MNRNDSVHVQECSQNQNIQAGIAAAFSELSEQECGKLAAASHRVLYTKNKWIFSEGDSLGTADWLLSGNAVLLKSTLNGKSTFLHVVRAGHFLDHCALLGSGKAIVSAMALDHCSLLRMDVRALREVLEGNACFALRLMRSLAVRQRMFINKITVSQGKISVRRRVAGWLLHKARVEKSRRLQDSVTREVLAGLLGLSRESLCRQLSRFVQEGIIRLEHKVILIEDEAGLRRCLNE